jgi:hypothetical protein
LQFFFYILLIVGFFTILYLSSYKGKKILPTFPDGLSWMLMLFVIFAMAFSPIEIYGDKYNYLNIFDDVNLTNVDESIDIGWSYYTFLNKIVFGDSSLYFLNTAFVYTLGYYVFAKKYIPKGTIFLFLLACFASFGFLAYGVNTIRAGFSMALLLIAFTVPKNKILFILFGAFAVLSHKSMALPLLAFIFTKYYNQPKMFLRFWLVTLAISFVNLGFITAFIQSNLGSFDERSSVYNSDDSLVYNTGFRIDFIIYSAIPILLGFYYIVKLKVNDIFYNRLFNTYLVVNAFWLLQIRMAFTDRMAYLSWFLLPFILLYPLLRYPLPIHQKKWVIIIVLGVFGFTTFMYFK